MPTIGWLSGWDPSEPKEPAPPNGQMPPSEATIQYWLSVAEARATWGVVLCGACAGLAPTGSCPVAPISAPPATAAAPAPAMPARDQKPMPRLLVGRPAGNRNLTVMSVPSWGLGLPTGPPFPFFLRP